MPAEEFGSPHGRLTGHAQGRAGPRRGYRVPHARATTGLGALYTPGTAVLLPAEGRARPAPAAPRRLVPDDPVPTLHPREYALRGINEGSSNSPVRSSPRPQLPGWNGPPLRLPLRLPHPADQEPTTHARAGTGRGARTWNYTLNSHPLILQSVVHSFRATSRRTVHCGSEAAGPERPNRTTHQLDSVASSSRASCASAMAGGLTPSICSSSRRMSTSMRWREW